MERRLALVGLVMLVGCGEGHPAPDPGNNNSVTCGNEVIESGEQCDGPALADQSCESLGFSGGGLSCALDCTFNTSACTVPPGCGNGVLDLQEECDGANLGGQTCDALGAGGGQLRCSSACRLDLSGCTEPPLCGNGWMEYGEGCDDSNTVSCDGCSAGCVVEACGNGIVECDEVCDDGNIASGDGCGPLCIPEACGNGFMDPGEICDDGNTVAGDGCSADCHSDESCGNGILDEAAGEQCDDGNTVAGDGCSPSCSSEGCGNAQVDPGEVCDDGNTVGGDGCSWDCLSDEVCGNGYVDYAAGESCDDGNTVNGDGCNADCWLEGCGNGLLEPGEVCDDGNNVNGDGCAANCLSDEVCGNGFVDTPLGESCDDGDNDDCDGCSAICRIEVCGNGVVECDEVCDDGNTAHGDGCSSTCLSDETCGNEIVDFAVGESCDEGAANRNTPNATCRTNCLVRRCGDHITDDFFGEQCDDGNTLSGDGCSPACLFEECGNGVVDPGEDCDDGNVVSGDGCSATCTGEFVCGDLFCDVAHGEQCQYCPGDCCPNCGNGLLDPSEECDTTNLDGETCASQCLTGGVLACTAWCTFDTSGCTGPGPVCSNGVAECTEQCDTNDFRGATCNSLGYDGGTLACDASCHLDVSGCGAVLWYLFEDFEDPVAVAATWSLTGDWDIGTPTMANEPAAPYSGAYVIGTVVGGAYSNNDRYDEDRAVSPPINLTTAVAPAARFQMWIYTETNYDGGNLWIGTNGGATWALVPTGLVTVPYNGYEGGYDCWVGSAMASWQEVNVDLSAYAGEIIQLGFSFYSDGSVTYPGFYVDDLLVAEPGAMP